MTAFAGEKMDNNTVQLLNNTVYQIYNIEDFESMKREVLNSLRFMVPNKCGTFLMAGGNGGGHNGTLHSPVCLPEKYTRMEEEYSLFEDRDFSSWILRKSRSVLVRITDLLDENARKKTEVYKRFFEPNGLHYSVDLTIISKGELLGCLTLYRAKDDGNFTDEELQLLRMLSDHLNARFSLNKYGHQGLQQTGIGQIGNLIERYSLTKREAEVLHRILMGEGNEQICEELFVSPNTLKKHLHNLYAKTGVKSRVQLLGIER